MRTRKSLQQKTTNGGWYSVQNYYNALASAVKQFFEEVEREPTSYCEDYSLILRWYLFLKIPFFHDYLSIF